MSQSFLSGVSLTELKIISDDRGCVMHMMRNDSPIYNSFGEVYFSKVYHNAVKAWKQHKEMIINLAVPVGKIKIVLYDERTNSPTNGIVQELFMSDKNYKLISIPPMIWTGFCGISKETSLIANFASIPHDPNELIRRASNDTSIPYRW